MTSDVGLRRYLYREAVNGFFEIPTGIARAILPPGLQPVEWRHGSGILAVTAFDFHGSPVGAYAEVALSVVIAPRLLAGEPMPRAAMFPFLVGTTTSESRQHGTECWRLPHHPGELEIRFARGEREIQVLVSERGEHILDLCVTDPTGVSWQTVEHRYQTLMHDQDGAYMAALVMSGPFLEHEEERGALRSSRHAFTSGIDWDDVATTPFREQWMTQGEEIIHPLQPLALPVGR